MTSPCTAFRDPMDLHFAGRLDPRDERALREHLPDCPACRDYYARHLLLARLDPQTPTAKERLGRGLGLRRPQPQRWVWAGAVGMAAAALLAVLGPLVSGDRGFASRGVVPAPSASLSVFRILGGRSEPVLGGISARDELAFAYENAAGRRHLLVFAEDAHGHIYWFFPAWRDESENPAAIAIEATRRPTELREAVRHGFDTDRIVLRAVFTDEPLRVREVESRLRDGRPVADDAIERRFELQVAP